MCPQSKSLYKASDPLPKGRPSVPDELQAFLPKSAGPAIGSTVIVKAQTAPHQMLILAEIDRVQHLHTAALETLEVTGMQGSNTPRRERQALLSVRALHERHDLLRRIARLAWEHLNEIRNREAEFMLLCGCAPPASLEHFTIQSLQGYFALARAIALDQNFENGHELRSSLVELDDEHDRIPELVLGPDEGFQDRLSMAERARQQAEFNAVVYQEPDSDGLVSPGMPHSGRGSTGSTDLSENDGMIVSLVQEGFTLAEAAAIAEARRTAWLAAEAAIVASLAAAKLADLLEIREKAAQTAANHPTAPERGEPKSAAIG